jgi:DNA mismatch repair protein MutS
MSLLEEYFELYEKHQRECMEENKIILLMQVGGFYEAYESFEGIGCAQLVSRLLNMNLTKKKGKQDVCKKNPYMTGFPKSVLPKHLTRLNDLGYTVFIYDQNHHDPTDRKLRGKYSPHLRMDFIDTIDVSHRESMTTIYCYLLEKYEVQNGRTRYTEFQQHFCWLEVHTGKIFFVENVDNSFQRMFEQFLLQNQPTKLLLYTEGFSPEEKDQLNFVLQKYEIKTKINDWEYHSVEYMREILQTSFDTPPDLDMYPSMMNCVVNLLDYIKNHDPILISNLNTSRHSWMQMENRPYLQFNRDIVRELFIFTIDESRKVEEQKSKTLYDILSKSMNIMAKRYLRRLLQRPLTSAAEIHRRYEKIRAADVTERSIFSSLIDLEWFYLRWKRESLSTRHLATLLQSYKSLEMKYPVLQTLNEFIANIWDIDKMSHDDMFFHLNDPVFATWKLDFQRKKDELYAIERKEEELKFIFCSEDIHSSYYQITLKKWNKWTTMKQNEYRQISKTSSIVKVMKLSADGILYDMFHLKQNMDKFLKELYLSQCRQLWNRFDRTLLELHQVVMEDSMYVTLKHFFEIHSYVCPKVKADEHFSVDCQNIRHAIIEHLFPDDIFVPFSLVLRHDGPNGKLIYGMNSSGKSTYMKSIALGMWMAQCGLWVPAEHFCFSPLQNMFSKFSHSDNLYRGQSLYVSEMSELRYMLEHSNKNSFLLLDELTSGTEVHSSSSLIVALLEEFLHKNIFFLFTTHIHWIAEYLKKYSDRIEISHFLFDANQNLRDESLIATEKSDLFNRKLQEGSGPSLYGIEVAEQLGISERIITRALHIRQHVTFEHVPKNEQKRSRYNAKLSMQECFRCQSRLHLHTHHIFPQKHFKDGKEDLNGFRKNALYNLIVLCDTCHQDVHEMEEELLV